MAVPGPRTRQREGSQPGGKYAYDGFEQVQSPLLVFRETNQDVVGFRQQDNAFLLTRSENKHKGSNLVWGPLNRRWENYHWTVASGFAGHLAGTVGPTSPQLAVLAGTNPSRATLSLPMLIGELRELPQLYRSIVDAFRSGSHNLTRLYRWGSNYVGYNFGVATLIRDIQTLTDFSEAVARRLKELEDLYDKGGMRKSVRLGSSTQTSKATNRGFVALANYAVNGDIDTVTRRQMWGSCRWKPLTKPPESGVEMAKLAKRVAYGTNGLPHIEDLWNLMPWSWLIDYFVNAGDLFGAMRNSLRCYPTNVCVMTETETTVTYRPLNNAYGGSLTKHTVTKQRQVGFVPPSTASGSLQILSGKQASILGALAVSRQRRI